MVDKALTDTPPAVLPPDPEKSGWHWIRGSGGNEFPSEWSPDPYAPMQIQGWWTVQNGRISDRHAALHGFAYIAPLDPTSTATALDEARAEVERLRQEIRRLKAIIRINALRHGYTDAEIEAVLSPRAAGTAQ